MLNIKLDNFDGPFDMLLFLIKKNKMNIYDIQIHEIAEQYIEAIEKMQEMDLEVTSEFIVMASTLVEIKSKMLLPKSKQTDENEEDDDPRNELVNKLIEYRRIKMAADFLKDRDIGIMFSKKPEIIKDKPQSMDNVLNNVSLLDLYNLFSELIKNFSEKMNNNNVLQKEVYADMFKIEDKMQEMMKLLYKKPSCSFSQIADKCSCKSETIVMFLAVLELIKLKNIKVFQENNYSEIFIERIIQNERK